MSENSKVKFTTNKGVFVAEIFEDKAPNTAKNFLDLVNKGFYDGIIFHRVIDGFMIQGGDPTGTGMGGPGKMNLAKALNMTTKVCFPWQMQAQTPAAASSLSPLRLLRGSTVITQFSAAL